MKIAPEETEADQRLRLGDPSGVILELEGVDALAMFVQLIAGVHPSSCRHATSPTTHRQDARLAHNPGYFPFSRRHGDGMPLGCYSSGCGAKIKGNFPPQYDHRFAGMYEIMVEGQAGLAEAGLIAVVLVLLSLAAIMESVKQPFFILITLPLALIGVEVSARKHVTAWASPQSAAF